jgi:hypothetical protein
VPSDTYRISVATSASVRGVLVKGLVWRSVTVDNRAPTVSSVRYGRAVYPVRDGYKDTLPVSFRINERAAVTLTVRNSTHHVVRTLRATRGAGAVRLTWNGRYASGRMVPAGSYGWQLSARDLVGNVGHTGWHGVSVSSKRLVTKSTSLSRNGDSFYLAGGSDSSCAEASTRLSDYAHGVWLANACYYTGGIAAAFYRVSLPSAVVYSHLKVQVYGWAQYAPSSVFTGFGVHGGSADFGISGPYEIRHSTEGWYTFGSINASRYVSGTHRANIAVGVSSDLAPCDFDVKQVRITLTYKVLR